jgi:DNA-binding transcriptional ArsR family regulator
MGVTKKRIHSTKVLKIAALYKALGHPARIAILQELSHHKTCYVKELSKIIGLYKISISQHLQELKKVDLVDYECQANRANYFIVIPELFIMKKIVQDHLGAVINKAA